MWPSRDDGCARPGMPWTGKLREISFEELKVMFIEPGSFEGSGLLWPSRGDGFARPGMPWTGKLREISFAEELKVMFIEHPPGPTLRGEGTEWACAADCQRMSVPGFIHFAVESGSSPMPLLC